MLLSRRVLAVRAGGPRLDGTARGGLYLRSVKHGVGILLLRLLGD